MPNNAAVMIKLLKDVMYMTIAALPEGSPEKRVKFMNEYVEDGKIKNREELLEDISVSFFTVTKQRKRIDIPLDFEILLELEDVVKTISAFASCGQCDTVVRIYKGKKNLKKVVYTYVVTYVSESEPHVLSGYEAKLFIENCQNKAIEKTKDPAAS